jgi:hypothetical protein
MAILSCLVYPTPSLPHSVDLSHFYLEIVALAYKAQPLYIQAQIYPQENYNSLILKEATELYTYIKKNFTIESIHIQ